MSVLQRMCLSIHDTIYRFTIKCTCMSAAGSWGRTLCSSTRRERDACRVRIWRDMLATMSYTGLWMCVQVVDVGFVLFVVAVVAVIVGVDADESSKYTQVYNQFKYTRIYVCMLTCLQELVDRVPVRERVVDEEHQLWSSYGEHHSG